MHKWSEYFVDSEKIGLYEQIFENLTIIDCHTHIGLDEDRHHVSAAQMVKMLDECMINKAICFPFNHPQYNTTFTKPNDLILKAHRQFPDRMIPFFRLNPNSDWKPEFDKRISQGFMGLKLHPRSQKFKVASAGAMKVYEAVQESGITLLLHTGFGVDENLVEELKKITAGFPKMKIILGHSAFIDIKEAVKFAKGRENIVFDISTIKIFDLYDLLKDLPHTQIVFGSDFPYYSPIFSLELLIDTAICTGVSINKIKSILGTNIMRWVK